MLASMVSREAQRAGLPVDDLVPVGGLRRCAPAMDGASLLAVAAGEPGAVTAGGPPSQGVVCCDSLVLSSTVLLAGPAGCWAAAEVARTVAPSSVSADISLSAPPARPASVREIFFEKGATGGPV